MRPYGKAGILLIALLCLTPAALLAACGGGGGSSPTGTQTPAADGSAAVSTIDQARQKINHVVIIMQENRSFDSYFGTFPGADGIPMENAVPTVCLPDPKTGQCVAPYHDPNQQNAGGPHNAAAAAADIDGGQMDGFIVQQRSACQNAPNPECGKATDDPDVMGYHDAREIPNYWTYAQQFVLQDRMFSPTTSYSLPVHMFMVSAWSAICTMFGDPMSCTSETDNVDRSPVYAPRNADGSVMRPDYAWTDITYLLEKANVSWAYYVAEGTEIECEDPGETCFPSAQNPGTPGLWNPLAWFDTVRENNQLDNIQTLSHFYDAAKSGTLPAVSWIAPSGATSEHPYWQGAISMGESYVTGLINAIMQGPNWDSTAIFLAWDDWGASTTMSSRLTWTTLATASECRPW